MKWSDKGHLVPTCIQDAGSFGGSVLVTCRCGHASRFNAKPLWWHFERRGWDDQFHNARRRFWCRVCGSRSRLKVRPVKIAGVDWVEGDFELPWPDERKWKEAMRRVR